MSARAAMTMRAYIQRNMASGTNALNLPAAPDYQPFSTTPCYAWSKEDRRLNQNDKLIFVEDSQLIMPTGTDIRNDDQIQQITDRQGSVLFTGPFLIEGISPKRTHIVVAFRRVE